VNLKWIQLLSVTSTNSYLQQLVRKGESRRETVVVADFQEHGRGQGDNAWQSEKGKNLLMSVLLFPEFLSASMQFQLSVVTSLAVCDTLKEFGVEPYIKWPNDILTGKGKIAGILIENGIMEGLLTHAIIGVGLNVNQVVFPEYPLRATSLAFEKPDRYDPFRMAGELVARIMKRYAQLKEGTGSLQQEEYLTHLFRLNKPARFVSGNRIFTGLIRGINEFGELLVEEDDHIMTYGMHAISFSREPE
jgi:BirA family biotin operon repressor/biotin-[acetyl-CoA-carboxylase] ligase